MRELTRLATDSHQAQGERGAPGYFSLSIFRAGGAATMPTMRIMFTLAPRLTSSSSTRPMVPPRG